MTSSSVAGIPVMFDTYSDGSSKAWVCVQVGSTPGVNSRVMVPISAGSFGVEPGSTVTFYPDAGTP